MSKTLFTVTSPNTDKEFEKYFQFRWEQLRQPLNLPQGSERDEYETQAIHRIAITQRQQIVGVGRLHFDSEQTTRIRYMATAKEFRRKGIGGAILNNLLTLAVAKGASMCWLKAREDACPFYIQHGFSVIDVIDSELPITHLRMEKEL